MKQPLYKLIYFNNKQKLYNLEVNLKTELCAIYMFAEATIFFLSWVLIIIFKNI